MAACGAGAGAAAAAAPGAAGAAGAAALAAASGWARTGAGAAPAPPSHGPWAEPASLAPPLQQHEDPTVRHALSQKVGEVFLAQARKKANIGGLTCHSQVIPAVPVNSKNHLCLHLPGQRESFWLPGWDPGTWSIWGSSAPSVGGSSFLKEIPADADGHPHPELLCPLLEATEGKVRSNSRHSALPLSVVGIPDTWRPEIPFCQHYFSHIEK